jgi:molybdopterin-guanine dinucleotide biosynthesis protein A
MRVELAASLREFVGRGQRKVGKWIAMHRGALVAFDDAGAFANANSAAELALLRPAP